MAPGGRSPWWQSEGMSAEQKRAYIPNLRQEAESALGMAGGFWNFKALPYDTTPPARPPIPNPSQIAPLTGFHDSNIWVSGGIHIQTTTAPEARIQIHRRLSTLLFLQPPLLIQSERKQSNK